MAGVVGLPFVVGLVDAVAQDSAAAIQSYTDLFASSKLVSASSVDAIILNLAAASLIPRDLKLRQPEKAFLGPALYCALRPALPPKDE